MEEYIVNNNKLTITQYSCLIFFPILALFSGIGTHNTIKIAGIDSYLSVIYSFLIGIIPLTIFLLIFNYKKELNIKEKIKYLFGNILGNIICFIINVLVLCIGFVLLYNISNFAISQFLAETPLLVFMITIGIVLVYNVSLGIENISRVAIIFLGIIFILTIISTTGILPNFETSNLKPFLENGYMPPLKGAITLTLTNVIPIFILLIVPKEKVENNKKLDKYIVLFYTLAFIFAFLAILLTIGSIGIYLCDIYQYPEYTVLKKISLFEFLDRIENFIYIKWILSSVTYLSLIIYYLNISIKKDSHKIMPILIISAMIFLALNIFENNTIFYNFILNIYPYICLLLFIIFFIIALNIIIRLLTKIDNKKNLYN